MLFGHCDDLDWFIVVGGITTRLYCGWLQNMVWATSCGKHGVVGLTLWRNIELIVGPIGYRPIFCFFLLLLLLLLLLLQSLSSSSSFPHFYLPQTPQPIHFLKAYDNSYSKTNREHKYKDKDEYKDNDKDKDTEKVPENPTYGTFLKSWWLTHSKYDDRYVTLVILFMSFTLVRVFRSYIQFCRAECITVLGFFVSKVKKTYQCS